MFAHHKFDSTHPGICFLCDPWKRSVTSEGGHISWLEIGIEINIPTGAVSEGKTLELRVRPCLSGPFVLPARYQLASPMYLVSPEFDFEKEVTLKIDHFAGLDSSSDCQRMTFISSSSTQSQSHSQSPKYHFKVMKGGVFKKKEHHGIIHLKHFCLTGLAQESGVVQSQDAQEDQADIQEDQAEKSMCFCPLTIKWFVQLKYFALYST